MEEHYDCPKMTPRQWVANFWYYYKWLFLVAVGLLTFFLIAIVQFSVKRDADYTILYVGPKTVSNATKDAITAYAENAVDLDQNKDGSVLFDVESIQLSSDYELLRNNEKIEANKIFQAYSDEILSGDAYILLLDPYFYEELSASGALATLKEIYGFWPEEAEDYYGVELRVLDCFKTDGFSDLPGNTVVCLKYPSVLSEIPDEEKDRLHEMNLAAFLEMFYLSEND